MRVVLVVLDDVTMALDSPYFHPLRNDRTSAIAPAGLLEFLGATGPEPVITALPGRQHAGVPRQSG